MSITFTLAHKARFYLRYFTDKVFSIWFEVRRPKLRMFLYEMAYSAMKFIDHEYLLRSPFGVDRVETIFGKFKIRPRSIDMSNVSPAFERPDVEQVLALIEGLVQQGRRVLFLDIGSDIGTFAVTVGNRFKDYAGLSILAFEPSEQSCGLIRENLALNGLEHRAEVCCFPLYDEDGRELVFSYNADAAGTSALNDAGGSDAEADSFRVVTRTLDSVIEERGQQPDVLVFKIDVEGVETQVIRGALRSIGRAAESHFMVEDFINPAVIDTLEGMGARFVSKRTPYNSFWSMGPSTPS